MSTFQALALLVGGIFGAVYILMGIQKEVCSLQLVFETGAENARSGSTGLTQC